MFKKRVSIKHVYSESFSLPVSTQHKTNQKSFLFYRLIKYSIFLECKNFTSLTDADRKNLYPRNSPHLPKNDILLGPGWFRFQGDAGTKMASSCPPVESCNTAAPGWLKDQHPTSAEGIVGREVCFHWGHDCCLWSTIIKVRNCSSYMVYHLHSTPYIRGSLRYCGSD